MLETIVLGLEKLAFAAVKCAPEAESIAAKAFEELLPQIAGKATPTIASEVAPEFRALSPKIIAAIKDQSIARTLFPGGADREFIVKGSGSMTPLETVNDAMKRIGSGDPNETVRLLVREIPDPSKPLNLNMLGPEKKMYIQHFGGQQGGLGIDLETARKADLLVNCYPELLPSLYKDSQTLTMLQGRHLFPWARGEVRMMRGMAGDNTEVYDTLVVMGSWNNFGAPLKYFK